MSNTTNECYHYLNLSLPQQLQNWKQEKINISDNKIGQQILVDVARRHKKVLNYNGKFLKSQKFIVSVRAENIM